MEFSVIYTVDLPAGGDLGKYEPPNLPLWDETEGDEQYEYGYLEGRWENGLHRKWAALLDRIEFDEFVYHCNLRAEDVHTLGSIGALGFGFHWAPAISFVSRDPDAIVSAYVTPIPEVRREKFDDHDWERIRSAVLAVYG